MTDPQVKVLGVQFLIYPLDLHSPVNLTITMNNTGNEITYIRQTIDIDWYGEPLFSCGWNALITLRDVDGCGQLGNCPQPHGIVTSHVNINMPAYENAIDLLPFDRVTLELLS